MTPVFAALARAHDGRPLTTVLAIVVAVAAVALMLTTVSQRAEAVRARKLLVGVLLLESVVLLVAIVAAVDSVGNPAAWRTAIGSRDGAGALLAVVASGALVASLGRPWVRQALLSGGAVCVVAGVLALGDRGPAEPVVAYASSGSFELSVSLEPGSTGPADLHLYVYDTAGSLTRFGDMTAVATPADGGAPLPVVVEHAGPGHGVGLDVTFPAGGTWRLDVTVPLSADEPPLTFTTELRLR
jgi:hypothetical protein